MFLKNTNQKHRKTTRLSNEKCNKMSNFAASKNKGIS